MPIEREAGHAAGTLEPLPPDMIGALKRDAFAGERDIQSIQTHISHLFLTSDRVYKIRKAVRFPFLSFATRAERNADCLREVRLNRRLAPDVYLGVAPIEPERASYRIGAIVEDIPQDAADLEHCVVMRRLREGGDGQSLLERGELQPQQVDAVAELVARFHEAHRLGTPAPFDPAQWRERVEAPVSETVESIEAHASNAADVARAAALRSRFRAEFEARSDAIERRRLEGRAVEGHGDLQLAHVWFDAADGPPVIIDCTEFNEAFRKIDAASEVAFHAMDLRYRGAPAYAERFLARYAAGCDDYDLYALVDLYAAYRSSVRAKVALLATSDDAISGAQREAARASANRHLDLAEAFLAPRDTGSVVLLCGTVGSGKSSVAHEFAEACSGVVISSDRTRKRLAGLQPEDHSAATAEADVGLYAPERKQAVYAALLERAAPVVESGRVAILDASYTARKQRDVVRAWAKARGVDCILIEARCDEAEARRRLERRERSGADASDAGPDFLATSLSRFEPPKEWPSDARFEVATDASDWREQVRKHATRRLPQPGAPRKA